MFALKATSNLGQSRVEALLDQSLRMYFKSDPISQQVSQQFFEFLKSPTPFLLESNMPPSDLEIESILETIRRTRSTRRTLFTDVNISGLKNPRNRKQREDDLHLALSVYEHRHRALFSPFRRLLPEILGIIFMEVFHDNQSNIYKILQVCRLWRDIALSFSEFWASFNINLSARYARSKAFLSSIDLKLRRSQQTGLNITLVMDWPDFTAPPKHPVFDKILETSNRWVTADFTVSKDGLHFLNRLDGRIESLRKLSLRSSQNFGDLGTEAIFVSFTKSPSLHQVRLSLPSQVHVSLPYEQLLVYEESYGNLTRSLHRMTLCRVLKLQCGVHDSPISDLITMNDLEVLHVTKHNAGDHNLFSRLRFPKLRDLQMTSFNLDAVSQRLASTIRNSPQPSLLQILKIANCGSYNASFLIGLLELATYLQELELCLSTTTECCRLTDFLSTPGALANLKVLRFVDEDNRGGPKFSAPGFINKLTSTRCERSRTSNIDSLASQDHPAPLSLSIHFVSNFAKTRMNNVHGELNGADAFELSYARLGDTQPSNWALFWGCSFITDYVSMPSNGGKDTDKALKGLEDEINVEQLLQLRIHIYLHHFAIEPLLPQRINDGYQWSGFQWRARRILRKWTSAILPDVPNKHWAMKRLDTLVYIPSDHVLRSTDPLQIIYGLVE